MQAAKSLRPALASFALSNAIARSLAGSLGIYSLTSAPVSARGFGIIQEYNERKNKKLINHLLANEEPKFWVTSSRPFNFGDHLDAKTKVDNWFDENR